LFVNILAVPPGVARAKGTSGEIVGNSQYYNLCVEGLKNSLIVYIL